MDTLNNLEQAKKHLECLIRKKIEDECEFKQTNCQNISYSCNTNNIPFSPNFEKANKCKIVNNIFEDELVKFAFLCLNKNIPIDSMTDLKLEAKVIEQRIRDEKKKICEELRNQKAKKPNILAKRLLFSHSKK